MRGSLLSPGLLAVGFSPLQAESFDGECSEVYLIRMPSWVLCKLEGILTALVNRLQEYLTDFPILYSSGWASSTYQDLTRASHLLSFIVVAWGSLSATLLTLLLCFGWVLSPPTTLSVGFMMLDWSSWWLSSRGPPFQLSQDIHYLHRPAWKYRRSAILRLGTFSTIFTIGT